jgi:excisionase family DNA binding protein
MYLTIKDVSQLLQIKPSTLYGWVAQGKIPAFKIHGMIRFQRDVIEQWMQAFRTDQEETPSEMVPVPRPEPTRRRRRHGADDVDALIARAKAEAYSSSPGDQTHATGRRTIHGSVSTR